MNKAKESEIGFKAETGELYMLAKKERILVRAILGVTLKSEAGRDYIAHKHGKESLRMARALLHQLGGDLDASY